MSSKQIPTKRLLSSLKVRFDFKVSCFLCSKSIDFCNKHSYSEVMILQLRESLIERGDERNDDWGKDIKCRLELCNDLVAEEEKYHTNCMTKFRLKDGTDKRRGRPEDVQMVKSFERVCIRLEETSDYKMYTIQEIHLKMAELNNPDNVYTTKRLKQKLKERYKDHLCFIELPRRTDRYVLQIWPAIYFIS